MFGNIFGAEDDFLEDGHGQGAVGPGHFSDGLLRFETVLPALSAWPMGVIRGDACRACAPVAQSHGRRGCDDRCRCALRRLEHSQLLVGSGPLEARVREGNSLHMHAECNSLRWAQVSLGLWISDRARALVKWRNSISVRAHPVLNETKSNGSLFIRTCPSPLFYSFLYISSLFSAQYPCRNLGPPLTYLLSKREQACSTLAAKQLIYHRVTP